MSNDVQLDSKQEDIKSLLEQNLELTKEIHQISLHIKKYIYWQRIFGFLKLFIILIPIIISIIYLPPLLNQVFDQYKTILDIGTSVNSSSGAIKDLSPSFFKFLN